MAQLSKVDLPFEVGEPGESSMATPVPGKPGQGEIPGYIDPWSHCANCEYFDGDAKCLKFNAPADMDGACPAFEKATEDDNAGEAEDES